MKIYDRLYAQRDREMGTPSSLRWCEKQVKRILSYDSKSDLSVFLS